MKVMLVFGFIALLISLAESYPGGGGRKSDDPTENSNSNQFLSRAGQFFSKDENNVSKSLSETKGTYENTTFEDYSRDNLPLHFDARDKWLHCSSLNHIREQGSCGSSWAVAAVSAMSDRLCIQSKGRKNVYFSELDVMSCCMYCGSACAGGILKNAWRYAAQKGVVSGDSGGCKPYSIPRCEYNNSGDATPTCNPIRFDLICRHKCQPSFEKSYRADLRKLKTVYNLTDIRTTMFDIYTNGPVTTNILVHEDFLKYRSGIYRYVTGKLIDNQSVKLLGWGEENGVKYWLAANSWGINWGDKGFFKIIRGINHLGIEDIAYTGIFRTSAL